MSLLDKMKETAQKGVDKTKEAVSAGQEKLEAKKIENEISELKEQLGGLVYDQKTGSPAADADAEIERIVGEIQTNVALLAKVGEADDDSSADDAATTDG